MLEPARNMAGHPFNSDEIQRALLFSPTGFSHCINDLTAPTMVKPEDVTGVAISLKVDDDLSLFALLAADGSINRLGTGTINNTEKEMFVGVISDPKPFQNLRAQIKPDLFKWVGGRADQFPKGQICELTIWLFLPNKEERIIHFKYGSESIGPPPEVKQLVLAAIDVTNPWYEQFKAGIVKKDQYPS